jgi:hypothetical protein
MLRTSYVQSDASEHRRLAPNAPMLLRKPGYLLQFTFSLRSVPFGCMNQPATRLFSTPAMIEAESETRQYWLVKGEPDVAMKGGLDLVRCVSKTSTKNSVFRFCREVFRP